RAPGERAAGGARSRRRIPRHRSSLRACPGPLRLHLGGAVMNPAPPATYGHSSSSRAPTMTTASRLPRLAATLAAWGGALALAVGAFHLGPTSASEAAFKIPAPAV